MSPIRATSVSVSSSMVWLSNVDDIEVCCFHGWILRDIGEYHNILAQYPGLHPWVIEFVCSISCWYQSPSTETCHRDRTGEIVVVGLKKGETLWQRGFQNILPTSMDIIVKSCQSFQSFFIQMFSDRTYQRRRALSKYSLSNISNLWTGCKSVK